MSMLRRADMNQNSTNNCVTEFQSNQLKTCRKRPWRERSISNPTSVTSSKESSRISPQKVHASDGHSSIDECVDILRSKYARYKSLDDTFESTLSSSSECIGLYYGFETSKDTSSNNSNMPFPSTQDQSRLQATPNVPSPPTSQAVDSNPRILGEAQDNDQIIYTEINQSSSTNNSPYFGDWANPLDCRDISGDHFGNHEDSGSFSEISEPTAYSEYLYNDHTDSTIESMSHLGRLRNTLNEEDINDAIDIPMVVSRADILLAIAKIGQVQDMCLSGISDLFKMLNYFIGHKIFPDTRYLVDQHFNSDSFIQYHALCPKCKKYVKQFYITERTANCTLCNNNFSLTESTYTDFFVTFDIQNEIKNMIENNADLYQISMNNVGTQKDTFDDISDGLLYRKFVNTLPDCKKQNFVSLTINTDGSPLFNSSKFSVWPVQAIIDELPYDVRSWDPIVCALWFSKSKPDMNVFFDPLVQNVLELSEVGISCVLNGEVRRVYVYTVCCCVDSGARPSMQGMVQYNGYYGCPWCLHSGVYVETETGGCVKFPLTDEIPPKRTDDQVICDMNASLHSRHPRRGVKRPSALINFPGLGVVSGFVPDRLHCIDHGVVPQLFDLWETSGNEFSLTKAELDYIDNQIVNLKVPNHIQRLTRSVQDRRFWKSLEYQNWLLYYSVQILLSIPHMQKYAKHLMLLVEAYFLLLKRSMTLEEVHKAHNLLLRFVADTEKLYLQSAMTFNIHQLTHLAQSVINWGPLYSHSGYCFENGNGKIIRKVHAAKGVIDQICRSIAMKQSINVLEKHAKLYSHSRILDFVDYLENKHSKYTVKIDDARYFGSSNDVNEKWIQELELSEYAEEYYKMVKNRCLFTSSYKERLRSNNSFAVTTDRKFVIISSFIVDVDLQKEYTICRIIETRPMNQNDVGNTFGVVEFSDVEVAVQTNTIDSVCVASSIDNTTYISILPNLYYS